MHSTRGVLTPTAQVASAQSNTAGERGPRPSCSPPDGSASPEPAQCGPARLLAHDHECIGFSPREYESAVNNQYFQKRTNFSRATTGARRCIRGHETHMGSHEAAHIWCCVARLPAAPSSRRPRKAGGGRRAAGGMLTSEGPRFEPGQSIMRSLRLAWGIWKRRSPRRLMSLSSSSQTVPAVLSALVV